MEEAFADRLMTNTNALIDISSNDSQMRSLANAMNRQLRELRAQRHRYLLGDMELKNAVTNIAHDLRTPLTAICGYLDLLEQEESTEASLRYIGIMKDRAKMLAELTEELFRYSMIMAEEGDGEREPVIVNEVLEESIAAFYHILMEQGITPDISMTEEKVVRRLDRSSLTRVFSNLLNNAAKYIWRSPCRKQGKSFFPTGRRDWMKPRLAGFSTDFTRWRRQGDPQGWGLPSPRRWWSRWAVRSLPATVIIG